MNKLTDETKIATIGKDIEYMRKDIAEINSSIKELSGVYVTKNEFDELENMVRDIKASNNLWKFLSPTFAAVVGSVMTFLIIQYLTNLK